MFAGGDGLRVAGLISRGGDDTLAIHFAEPADRVRDVLVRTGFTLPRAGQWRQADYSSRSPTPIMGVEAEDGGATLYCGS